PGAVHRVTSAAQRAVDRLDWIARGAQHDERNRVLVCQSGLPELREDVKRRAIVAFRRRGPTCFSSLLMRCAQHSWGIAQRMRSAGNNWRQGDFSRGAWD